MGRGDQSKKNLNGGGDRNKKKKKKNTNVFFFFFFLELGGPCMAPAGPPPFVIAMYLREYESIALID
jgi:hypothetical protein